MQIHVSDHVTTENLKQSCCCHIQLNSSMEEAFNVLTFIEHFKGICSRGM